MAGDTSIKGKITNALKGLQTFVETDSREIGVRSTINGDQSVKTRYIEIPTPAWFPDSFLRSLKRNNYFSMVNNASFTEKNSSISSASNGSSLDFYREDDSGAISKLVKNAAKSVLSTAANQIMSLTSKADSLISGVKSIFSSNTSDTSLFNAIKSTSSEPFLAAQPYLQIYGIHMTEAMRDTITALNSIIGTSSAESSNALKGDVKSADTTSDAQLAGTLVGNFLNKATKKTAETLKNFMGYKESGDLKAILKKMFTDDTLRMHGIAEALINCTVSGTYTMMCKLPYFLNPHVPIMASCGEDGFGGLGNLRKNAGKAGNIMRRSTGLNMVWTNPIEWDASHLSRNFTPVKLSFDIFNDTIEHAITNLFFIWSFGATSKAVTDAMFVRPPFLYNITVPGGFRYKYCTCRLEICPNGKLRKLSPFTSEDSDNPVFTLFNNIFGYSVNPKSIEYIPDSYNVSMVFTSLLPDLWNFMDTYLRNSEYDKVELGNRIQTKMAALVESWNGK